jgi:hypothetical protein
MRLRNRLLVADQWLRDGRLDHAAAIVAAVAPAIERGGFPTLDAELAWMRAAIANDPTDPRAVERLRTAAATVERAHDDDLAARAWIQVAEAALRQPDERARAGQDLAQARAAIDRLGGDPALEARLASAQALLRADGGDAGR